MKTKHTPGKWSLSSQKVNDIINRSQNTEETWFNFCVDLPNHLGALQSCSINKDEAEANAKLIAAAPELLEACIAFKEFVYNSKYPVPPPYITEAFNNAIEKATK